MSLILPPRSTLAGRQGGFGAKKPYLKVFGAFLAGAVIAGAAIKGPASSTDADGAVKQQASDAKPQAPAKPERAPDGKAKPAGKTQTGKAEKAAAEPKLAESEPVKAAPEVDETVTTGPAAAKSAAAAAQTDAPAAPQAQAGAEAARAIPVPPSRPVFAVRRNKPAPEQAPIVAATEPADIAAPAPRPAKRKQIAIRKPKRPAVFDVAERSEPVVLHERGRTGYDRERRNVREERVRSLHARNEAEGFNLVRSRVLPDGRRVTVYRRYDEPPARMLAFEDTGRPLFRSPFGFLGLD